MNLKEIFTDEVLDKLSIEANDLNLLKTVFEFYKNYQYKEYIRDIDIDLNQYFEYPKKQIIKEVIAKYDETYGFKGQTQEEIMKEGNVLVLLYMYNILENFLNQYGVIKPIEIHEDKLHCEAYKERIET